MRLARFNDAVHRDFEFFLCDMVRIHDVHIQAVARISWCPAGEAIAVRDDLALLPNDAPGLFPIFLKLANRRCLAVGAGKVAEPRIEALLNAMASVLVIAPKVTSSVHEWSKE